MVLFVDMQTVLVVAIYNLLNSCGGIQEIRDGAVMIERINDVGNVFAHAAADVPGALQKLGRLINQVCSQNPVDQSIAVSLVKFLKTAGKQTEGREYKNTSGLALLQTSCDLEHTLTGGNHVIDDDHVLALNGGAKEFVGQNRIAAVHYSCIVSSLVEHTHVEA